MKPVVLIDANKKEYKLFKGKKLENHIFSDELLDKDDIELFRTVPDSFMYEPENAA